jgi:hypothetical protein
MPGALAHGVRVLRIALVAILLPIFATTGIAEPCNPVIDGTYCATNSSGRPDISGSPRFATIRNIGDDISTGQDQPGTLGAITFGGNGTRCIGLLRRGRCN